MFSHDEIDLAHSITRLRERSGWLDWRMQAMAVTLPKAVLWQMIRSPRKLARLA